MLLLPAGAYANVVTPQFTSGTTFTITDTTLPWTLETTSRSAGLVEQWDTTRNFTINSTTTSLSVFSQ